MLEATSSGEQLLKISDMLLRISRKSDINFLFGFEILCTLFCRQKIIEKCAARNKNYRLTQKHTLQCFCIFLSNIYINKKLRDPPKKTAGGQLNLVCEPQKGGILGVN